MNDSNLFENGEPGRRNKKLPILLIVLAIILGVVIWFVKKTGESPTSVSNDTASVSQPIKPAEPAKVQPVAPAPAAPEVAKSAPSPVVAPVKPKHKHKPAIKAVEQTPIAEKPAPKVAEAAPKIETPVPVTAPTPTPAPAAKVPPAAPVVKVVPVPAAPVPKTSPTPAPEANKKFAMEDQPMPEKSALSDEGRLALNTAPKAPESKAVNAAVPSGLFKQGMEAFRKQDYANAIKLLEQLPKPATKQRGDQTRDEYVDAQKALAEALVKSDRTGDAVNAYTAALEYDKYDPVSNMNLGICYVELKQYSRASKAFEAVTRDQSQIDPAQFDNVMQRTKYWWALAWTRMYKTSKDADRQAYYQQQAVMRWKDYQTWFGKNEKYRSENRKAEDYIKSLSAM